MTGKNAAALIAGCVLIVAVVVAGVVVLQLHGKDVSPLLTVVTVLVVPLLGAVGALKLGEIHQGTQTTVMQTNGNMTRAFDLVERLAGMLGSSTPTTAVAIPVAPEPVPTEPKVTPMSSTPGT